MSEKKNYTTCFLSTFLWCNQFEHIWKFSFLNFENYDVLGIFLLCKTINLKRIFEKFHFYRYVSYMLVLLLKSLCCVRTNPGIGCPMYQLSYFVLTAMIFIVLLSLSLHLRRKAYAAPDVVSVWCFYFVFSEISSCLWVRSCSKWVILQCKLIFGSGSVIDIARS